MVSELMDERQRWNRLAKEKKLGQVENRDGWFYEKELGGEGSRRIKPWQDDSGFNTPKISAQRSAFGVIGKQHLQGKVQMPRKRPGLIE